MQPILVTLTVDAFDHFLDTFGSRGLPLRARHGCAGAQVMQHADDDERVTLLFDWDPENFRRFLADPEVQASMREGGTLGPPQTQVLTAPARFPA